jgi:hypothetical protein
MDSRIIGSITGTWVDYMLIFDSNLTAETIHDFYEQSLIDKGWKEAPTMQGGGFTSQSYLYKTYCYEQNKAALGVETPPGLSDKTSIRLNCEAFIGMILVLEFAENNYNRGIAAKC